jgi:prepilin-type processing-associated H-X9-DG protein
LSQHLASQPKVLFCPGSDQPVDTDAELAKVGHYQAQSSFYYRHAGNTLLHDTPAAATPDHLQLDHLGENRNGLPIRALAIDTIFRCPPDLATYGVQPKSNHRQRVANILFSDGHIVTRQNVTNRFTVDLSNYADITSAFDKILQVLERADLEQ